MARIAQSDVVKAINVTQLAAELTATLSTAVTVRADPGASADWLTNGYSKRVTADDGTADKLTQVNLQAAITAHVAVQPISGTSTEAPELQFYVGGTLAAFTNVYRWTNHTGVSQTIIRAAVRTDVGGEPGGHSLDLNIKVDGVLASNVVKVADGSATGGPFDLAIIVPIESVLTVDIAAVGSSTPGTGLDVQMFRRAT